VEREEQLSWERRVGRPVAIASFASAVLLLAALVYSSSAISQEGTNNDTVDGLFLIHDFKAEVLITTFLQGLSTALLAAPLWFLFEATRFRRPEIPKVARYLALIGPPLAGLLQIIRQFQVAGVADDVHAELSSNPRGPDAANDYARDLLGEGSLQIVGGLGLAAGLAIAFAFIIIALNAMRAGLLSRFMGILGIFVGVVMVIPLGVQVLQLFWFAALGMLFLDRWPGGRGPAWQTGEEIPWPGAAEQREEIERRRAEREGVIEPEPEPDAEAVEPRPKSRKRRKRNN